VGEPGGRFCPERPAASPSKHVKATFTTSDVSAPANSGGECGVVRSASFAFLTARLAFLSTRLAVSGPFAGARVHGLGSGVRMVSYVVRTANDVLGNAKLALRPANCHWVRTGSTS